MQGAWVGSLGWEDPWRRKWLPTSIFTPGESHGLRSLEGYIPQGRKRSDTAEQHTHAHAHPHKHTPHYLLQLWLKWASLVAQRLKRLPAIWETWVQSLGQEDPLEKEMATHSSILAWRIPWTE